jgi:hypothetical protein
MNHKLFAELRDAQKTMFHCYAGYLKGSTFHRNDIPNDIQFLINKLHELGSDDLNKYETTEEFERSYKLSFSGGEIQIPKPDPSPVDALHDLYWAVPKETDDKDWMEDDLRRAIKKAKDIIG